MTVNQDTELESIRGKSKRKKVTSSILKMRKKDGFKKRKFSGFREVSILQLCYSDIVSNSILSVGNNKSGDHLGNGYVVKLWELGEQLGISHNSNS